VENILSPPKNELGPCREWSSAKGPRSSPFFDFLGRDYPNKQAERAASETPNQRRSTTGIQKGRRARGLIPWPVERGRPNGNPVRKRRTVPRRTDKGKSPPWRPSQHVVRNNPKTSRAAIATSSEAPTEPLLPKDSVRPPSKISRKTTPRLSPEWFGPAPGPPPALAATWPAGAR